MSCFSTRLPHTTGIEEELCQEYADILSCAKIGIIPPAGIVFCYLNSCHFYLTEIDTFIDTCTSDLPKQRIRTMISKRFSTLSISSRRV